MARSRQSTVRPRHSGPEPHPQGEHPADEWLADGRFSVEQRSDGAVVVRVHSAGRGRDQLPDAVFAFRCGDPQYSYWLSRVEQSGRSAST